MKAIWLSPCVVFDDSDGSIIAETFWEDISSNCFNCLADFDGVNEDDDDTGDDDDADEVCFLF